MVKGILATAFFAVAAGALYGKEAVVAVLAGGLVASANFRLSSGILRQIVAPGVNPSLGKAVGIFSFLFRYLLLGVVLLVAIRGGISPVFFIIGLSTLVVAVFASAGELKRGEA